MSETAALQDRFNILQNFVLNDAASLQSALEDSDQTHVLNYCPDDQLPLLIRAAEQNFVLLLRAKANVNLLDSEERSSLMVAAERGRDEMVALLLEQPDVEFDSQDVPSRTALMYAAGNGHTSIVRRLLAAKASVGSSLVSAADGGHCDVLELLLQHKADVDARDNVGDGCLHRAAYQEHPDAVSLLLKANASVDMVGRCGETPLMAACYTGYLFIVRLFLAAGANVNHRDDDHSTALHEACSGTCQTIVDELLQAGADPNAVDMRKGRKGRTALGVAAGQCWNAQLDIMSSLLNAKADINLGETSESAPLTCAAQYGTAPQVKLLLQNGAKVTTSARRAARERPQIQALFECSLCGWEGMCCLTCRNTYCVIECEKFSDEENSSSKTTVDCRLHQKIAHQSVLEWTLAMSTLNLPPYVLETIFNSLKLNSKHEDYQQRKGIDFISIANTEKSSKINANFIHLIIEERTHQQNIRLFISVQKAFQKSQENKQ